MPSKTKTKSKTKFNGLDPKTNELVFKDGTPRDPGIDPDAALVSDQ